MGQSHQIRAASPAEQILWFSIVCPRFLHFSSMFRYSTLPGQKQEIHREIPAQVLEMTN